jgi:predicted membrane protein
MKVLFRVIGVVLLGWFAFVMGAMVFAALRRQEVPEPDPKADEVDLAATFGPLEFHSEAGSFRGGNVTTWFGGGQVDLSEATLAPEGATLHVNALFGGGNLIVPDTWNVETNLVGIGGAGDGRPKSERPEDAPTLRIEGTAIFGGWGITSSEPGNGHEELVTA